MLSRALFFLALPFSLLLLFSSLSFAHADSVLWDTVLQKHFQKSVRAAGVVTLVTHLDTPGISVNYHTSVFEIDSAGTKIRPLTSGTLIPSGTRALFEFPAPVDTDISWYGTGWIYGTPYGTWSSDANDPRARHCSNSELYASNVPIGDSEYGYAPGGTSNLYAALAVNPPRKDVQVTGSGVACTNVSGTSNKICTLSAPGTVTATFTFSPTVAKFYGDASFVFTDSNFVSNSGGVTSGCSDFGALTSGTYLHSSDYSFDVPAQTIQNTYRVGPVFGNPPTTPTLSSAGSCVARTPHAINFVSTDPDGDALRYGIDWDASGSVDQWIPGSGFVPSGSSQTASRTYAIAGSKTVKVMAQDTNGLSSAWATISFGCTGPSSGAGDNSSAISGMSGTGSGNGAGAQSPGPVLSLRLVPSLVTRGMTTQIHWGAENVVSCTVSGQNGDRWSGLESPLGGESSQPITSRTVYTLSCHDADGNTHTKTAWVGIAPNWRER